MSMTFETFNVNSTNKIAYIAAKGMVKRNYITLYIYGNSGRGKTHLLNSVYTQMLIDNPTVNIVYEKFEIFLKNIRSDITETALDIKNYTSSAFMNALWKNYANEYSTFAKKYRADAIILDEVPNMSDTTPVERKIFRDLIRAIYLESKIVGVFAGKHSPREMLYPELEHFNNHILETGIVAPIGDGFVNSDGMRIYEGSFTRAY